MVPWVFFISWFAANTRVCQYCTATTCYPPPLHLSRLVSLLWGWFLIECSKSFVSISFRHNSKPVVFSRVFIFYPKIKMVRTRIWFKCVACIWFVKDVSNSAVTQIPLHLDGVSVHCKQPQPGMCLFHRNWFCICHTNVNKEPEGYTRSKLIPSPPIRCVLCTVFPSLPFAH